MPKLVPIKPKNLVKILGKLWFIERDAEWSHVFFGNSNWRTTIIPIHNKDISKWLLRKILNDIDLSVAEYDKFRIKN